MVKMFKKFIAGVMGATLFMMTSSCSLFEDITPPPQCTTMVSAEVLEPRIVKTEKWTSSYHIGEDETEPAHFPLECEMNIYNDGTVEIYYWSAHEWTSFETYTCAFIMDTTIPYTNTSSIYLAKRDLFLNLNKNGEKEYSQTGHDADMDTVDVSYYPETYRYMFGEDIWTDWYPLETYAVSSHRSDSNAESRIQYYRARCAPCHLPYEKNEYSKWQFIPNKEVKETKYFRILGHDIVITPELLQSTDFIESNEKTHTQELESQINDLNTQIEQLKLENARLEQDYNSLIEENEQLQEAVNIQCGDTNGDGKISVADPLILMRYNCGTVDNLPFRGKKDNEGKAVPEE